MSAVARARLPTEVRVLVAAGFVVAIGYGVVAPALPEYARSFDVGVTAASAVVSGFALFRLLFAPASGWLLHRLGEQRVFFGGVLVVAASSAACAFAADYNQLLLFRALGGIGSTMFTVAAASLLIKISPPDMRGRAAAAWATGFLLGNIAGPLIGGGLIVFNLKAPFLTYAVLLVLAGVIIVALLRGREVAQPVTDTGGGLPVTFRSALKNPTFRACLASNFLNGWTVYGVRVALVPLFVVDVLGLSNGWSGVALTAFAVGTAATLTVGGQLADQWGRQPTAVAGSVLVAVTMGWLGFAASPFEMVVACALSGAGTGLLTPPVGAAVADVLSTGRGGTRSGAPLAGYQMVGDVGAIVGPVLAGLVVEFGGYQTAFMVTAVLAAGSIRSWWRAPDGSRQGEDIAAPGSGEAIAGTARGAGDQAAVLAAPSAVESLHESSGRSDRPLTGIRDRVALTLRGFGRAVPQRSR